jgi:hypothetical protein
VRDRVLVDYAKSHIAENHIDNVDPSAIPGGTPREIQPRPNLDYLKRINSRRPLNLGAETFGQTPRAIRFRLQAKPDTINPVNFLPPNSAITDGLVRPEAVSTPLRRLSRATLGAAVPRQLPTKPVASLPYCFQTSDSAVTGTSQARAGSGR